MSDLITYDDKVRLKSQNVSEKYKVTAGDMNEIKSVVNTNAEEVDEINKPENWVSVGTTAPTDGRRVWFKNSKNLIEPLMATTTLNGVTCTNNGDGSFTLNGTATASASFRLDQSTYNGTNNLKTYNGTYTLSCDEIEDGLDLRVMQNSTWESLLRMINSNTPVTATVDKNNCFIYINVANGKSVNNLTIRPMLQKGSVANSFEPYVEPSINVDGEELYIKPKVLWSGKATSVDVDLTGYNFIEVIFCSNDNYYNSLKVPVEGDTFTRILGLCNNYLSYPMGTNGIMYLKYGKAVLTQAGITIQSNAQVTISSTASQIQWTNAGDNLLYITTIIGYK